MIPAGATGPQSGHAVVNEPVTTYVVTATFAAANPEVNIFPNPVSSALTVDVENGLLNDLSATLYNPLGQAVTAAAELHPSVPTDFDLSNLAAGIYFLQVTGNGVMARQKVVVTH